MKKINDISMTNIFHERKINKIESRDEYFDGFLSKLYNMIDNDFKKIKNKKGERIKINKYIDYIIENYFKKNIEYRYLLNYKFDKIYLDEEEKDLILSELNKILMKVKNIFIENKKFNSYEIFLVRLFNRIVQIYKLNYEKMNYIYDIFNVKTPKFFMNSIYGMSSSIHLVDNPLNKGGFKKTIIILLISQIFLNNIYKEIEENYEKLLEEINMTLYFEIIMNNDLNKILSNKYVNRFIGAYSGLDYDGDKF